MKKILILSVSILCIIYFLFPVTHSADVEIFHIREMERVSFKLFHLQHEPSDIVGYHIINGKYMKLPIGSTLDKKGGIFNWMPGPGFLGKHELYFKSEQLGVEKRLDVFISPKYGQSNKLRIMKDASIQSLANNPFGSFDTPVDGSTVQSSIAVTGWALDDMGVKNVKIYRKSGASQVYIGDAVFVDGARPDVAAAYPGYPNNTQAGWGYMLLTNFLPNSGNGTFTLLAKATDYEENQVNLGSKTIIVDNKNAVKPFGAIDTPTQGGTASGSSFVNWGWVLTPQPNNIPIDGSTISVWVDGVNVGHPEYNLYRSDIANKFPGYANSNGAIGYFYLDTTAYENGVHTIQWTATDSAGNTDGIGSRYFTIKHTSVNGTDVEELSESTTDAITDISEDGMTITFDTSASDTSNLEVGDFIIGGVSESFPYGVLREIISSESTTSSHIINTQTASIEDVIEEIDLSETIELNPSDIMIARMKDGVTVNYSPASREFNFKLVDVIFYDQDGNHNTPDDQVRLEGEITFSSDLDIDLAIKFPFRLNKFKAAYTYTANIEVIAHADLQFGLMDKSVTIYSTYLTPRVFPTPIGPIVITPKIDIIASISGEATASVQFGAGAGVGSTFGVQYSDGDWSKIKTFNKNFYKIGPTLDANLNVIGQVGPKFSLLLYDFVGPYLTANIYGELNANINNDPWWNLYGGFNVGGGVYVEFLSKTLADQSFPNIIDYKVELANSGGSGTKEYTLTVSKGTGVDGNPSSGSANYYEGDTVNYNYSLKSGYTDLQVTLDGAIVPPSGTISMDKDHTLVATATPQGVTTYKLTVTRGTGVNGTPVTGETTYNEGTTASYSYSLQSGYTNLVVKLDGNIVTNTGTITMNSDHTLVATAQSSVISIEWVNIPAGEFEMGDNFFEGDSNERPVHTVYLSAYKISKYEVTFDQYDAFCDDTGRSKPDDNGWGRGSRPVINVNWDDAKAFCDWMSLKTGTTIKLPTEAQWEKAARGTDQRRYPWGDSDPSCSKVNYNNCQGKTMPVGSYSSGVSPYGVHDMAGNVVEWCKDWYSASYYSSSPYSNPQGPSSGSYRVSRGGSWDYLAYFIRSARRNDRPPSNVQKNLGFRIAQN